MRESIFFKLNILFGIALTATIIAAFSILHHISMKDHTDLVYKTRIILKEIRNTKDKPVELFDEFKLLEIKDANKRKVLQNARRFDFNRVLPPRDSHPRLFDLLSYRGDNYIHIHTRHSDILLKEMQSFRERHSLFIVVVLVIIVLLVGMYWMIRRTLKPLKLLEYDIIAYGNGEFPKYQISTKKDEISLVSNAFYEAIEKSKNLINSRRLFLRNIFHELNTPITKGKILAQIVEDSKNKELLDSIFSRLSNLLHELAELERVTLGDYTLNLLSTPIIELIDQARDLLYIDEPLQTNITNEMIKADFNLMSIVFKNLIENAQKYASNLEIRYENNSILFISHGERLSSPIEYYTQPFTKEVMGEQKGFGLGLYIVSEILQKHKMKLEYIHKEEFNIFSISL